MDSKQIEEITRLVVKELAQGTKSDAGNEVLIGISARHVHVTQAHVEALFGAGYQLTKYKDLSMQGQYAAHEQVTLVGTKTAIENVRILGPVRKASQVEISMTDARTLGVSAPVRESGHVQGSAPIALVGPKGAVYLEEGCIVAARHVHMPPEDAARLGVQDGQEVCLRIRGARAATLHHVKVRVDPTFVLELHIDTDEANAAGAKNSDRAILIK